MLAEAVQAHRTIYGSPSRKFILLVGNRLRNPGRAWFATDRRQRGSVGRRTAAPSAAEEFVFLPNLPVVYPIARDGHPAKVHQ